MTLNGWLQIILILAAVVAFAIPLGAFMGRVFAGERTVLTPILGPVERGFYRLAGIDPAREQGWLAYTLAMLAFNAAGFVLLYAILRAQAFLPLNPQGFSGLSPHLAFNTAVSFVTNTNWQSYGGETTMSHLSQMAGLTVQNFLSAATGIALAVALVRAFARSGAQTVGNFFTDMTRATLYVLLPLAIATGLWQVSMGTPQTLEASATVQTLEGQPQTLALGPVASQLAIKQLGTNGGGFYNANAAHPYENPTPLSNALTIWQMLVVSTALVFAFGRLIGDRRQAVAILSVMGLLLVSATAICYWAESAGTPVLAAAGLDPTGGNMEGKEVRFGLSASSMFAAVTTGLSDGAVNSMHGSFTPIGGMVPMVLIMLGEILPGGVGSGLYGILVIAIISVFVAGLMVGRTPEYLGKKIEAKEMKMAVLAILILPATILGFSAVSAVLPAALSGLGNAGPHGLSEIYYAYTSAAGNNGSAFGGLSANSPWWNTTLGLAMLLGRFAYIVPMMAIAGSLVAKTKLAPSAGTFPTHGPLFVGLLAGIILILGGLQFFPALALGPIAEQVQMLAGKTF
ncbi:potassium-transporting ATPase subunit KdpA [Aureimonas phyllosphaerae]|uniref:Potassium-transporting ATPase potassium-binding subunit n=1 Tax=Aureimonas phyllosphaerae TaxID=1166078 RepID=A0A7W6BUJ4_9HYPH|nr:potassium-transporting ATPase subunit KdpA [Aureimonas phyllosphaerae]MBB3937177.1 K+-transporting ATPase ATPase A chain [Aureimonas phyllosphaerae]MBB3961186.1 K+-transporting ATPase ATPase A chain [Aureimonas phyllosphaerae]SFF48650.1 K+-transporting ATPase ATPase A chain [Aureimonas phyllosphaerae]